MSAIPRKFALHIHYDYAHYIPEVPVETRFFDVVDATNDEAEDKVEAEMLDTVKTMLYGMMTGEITRLELVEIILVPHLMQ